MLVDPGATSHVCGLESAEGLREAVSKAGLGACEFNRDLTRDFTFGDGKSLSTTGTAYFPVILSGRSFNLPVSILDARSPPLLGVNILNESGAIVDFGRNPGIWFTGLDGPKQPCIRLPTGHLAVRIVPENDALMANLTGTPPSELSGTHGSEGPDVAVPQTAATSDPLGKHPANVSSPSPLQTSDRPGHTAISEACGTDRTVLLSDTESPGSYRQQ
jgi:hypothetical protein